MTSSWTPRKTLCPTMEATLLKPFTMVMKTHHVGRTAIMRWSWKILTCWAAIPAFRAGIHFCWCCRLCHFELRWFVCAANGSSTVDQCPMETPALTKNLREKPIQDHPKLLLFPWRWIKIKYPKWDAWLAILTKSENPCVQAEITKFWPAP